MLDSSEPCSGVVIGGELDVEIFLALELNIGATGALKTKLEPDFDPANRPKDGVLICVEGCSKTDLGSENTSALLGTSRGVSEVLCGFAITGRDCTKAGEVVAGAKLDLPKTNPDGAKVGDKGAGFAEGCPNVCRVGEGPLGLLNRDCACDFSVVGSVETKPGSPD